MRSLVVVPVSLLLASAAGIAFAEDETVTEPHMLRTEVHFESDSAVLSDSARAELDRAADWIKNNDAGLILIEGYADGVGTEPYNKRLGNRRAAAARQYLVERGVPNERIRTISFGESLLAIDTSGSERANRRIVLVGIEKEPIVETRTETRTERVEVPVERTVYVVRTPRPRPARRPLGLQVMAGGGVTGFVDDYSSDVTDVGGLWTARVTGGAKQRIGFEVAYVGTAQDLNMLADDAAVVGNGVEGNLRLNLAPALRFQPYLFAGLGLATYDVTGVDASVASMKDSDTVMLVPAGAGVGIGLIGDVSLDVRGTLRGALGDTMFDRLSDDSNGLENWSVTAQLGLGF